MSRPDRVSPARLAEGDGATRPPSNDQFTPGLKKPDQKPVSVDEAIKESFPASDPPAFTAGTETDPVPTADRAADARQAANDVESVHKRSRSEEETARDRD